MTAPSSPRSTARPTLALVALAGVLVAAAGLRLYHLDTESVWLDESFSVATARTTLSNIVAETGQDVHPPLHYFLLHFWGHVAGGSAWAARLLSVLFSLGTVIVTYAIGTRLRSRAVGLAAATLLAGSVFHIEFAQEARMYALLALLASLSTYGFIRLFDDPSPRWLAFFVVVTTLMVYTQAYAAFVLAGQSASLGLDALRRREEATTVATRWVLGVTCVFAAFLPWLAIFVWQFTAVQSGFWIPEPEWSGLVGPFVAYAGSQAVLALLAPLVVLGIIRMWRAEDRAGRSPLLFVGPWLFAPIVLPFILSRISSPIFMAKYTIAASVPFALLAADGIALLPWTIMRVLVLAAFVVLTSTPLQKYYGTMRKDNWRAAVPMVERQAQAGDLLLFYPYFHQIPFDFYRERDDLVEQAFPLFSPPPPSDGWARAMERAVGRHRRVWLVTLLGDPTKPIVLEQFRMRMTEASHQVMQHVDVYLFEK